MTNQPTAVTLLPCLRDAMQEAWNDICDDTGCHPLDIKHGRGKVLFFSPGHWADLTALYLEAALTRSPQPPSSDTRLREALRKNLGFSTGPNGDGRMRLTIAFEVGDELEAFSALNAALPASPTNGGEPEKLGCDYCNNDGPLIRMEGHTPLCPRCDAEYPEEPRP